MYSLGTRQLGSEQPYSRKSLTTAVASKSCVLKGYKGYVSGSPDSTATTAGEDRVPGDQSNGEYIRSVMARVALVGAR